MKKIAVYLALINLLTFAAYGIDKRKAQKNAWRIKESTLLLLAAAGGSVGVPLILLVQIGLAVWWVLR